MAARALRRRPLFARSSRATRHRDAAIHSLEAGVKMRKVVADARIVLVPGGFTGAWMWADVAALLEDEGIEAIAVELPTIGEDSAGADFYADARVVRELLDRLEPPVVLCGHSYGGAVITEAAAGPHPAVRELVYLTAAVPGAGDSMVALMSEAVGQQADADDEGVTIRDDGLAFLDREAARRALFNDCEPERAEDGLRRLRPTNLSGGDQPVSEAAWTQLPSIYVRGSEDPMPEAVAASFLDRTSEVIELPCGHCPNWSRPDLVARLLADRARLVASESA
jgi:pimeloyl-ACP methyl ester carboxylesterase